GGRAVLAGAHEHPDVDAGRVGCGAPGRGASRLRVPAAGVGDERAGQQVRDPWGEADAQYGRGLPLDREPVQPLDAGENLPRRGDVDVVDAPPQARLRDAYVLPFRAHHHGVDPGERLVQVVVPQVDAHRDRAVHRAGLRDVPPGDDDLGHVPAQPGDRLAPDRPI